MTNLAAIVGIAIAATVAAFFDGVGLGYTVFR